MKRFFFLVALVAAVALTHACVTTRGNHGGDAVDSVRIYVFDCGENDVKDIGMFAPGLTGPKKLAVACYVIRHPFGNLLWDSGLSDSIADEKDGVEAADGNFHLTLKTPFLKQLSSIGLTPADMKYIAFSHFHSDHVGNANAFVGATLLIQQEEYDAAFGPEPQKYRYKYETYNQLAQTPTVKLHGDHDVFGDGSVIIKRSVGHTPGHQSLFVNLAKTGPILISGDLYHFADNRIHSRVPSFNFDKQLTENSMRTIENFIRETKAVMWIEHDYEQNQSLRHAPEYYE